MTSYALPRGDGPRRHPLPAPARKTRPSAVYVRRVGEPMLSPLELARLDGLPAHELPAGVERATIAEPERTFAGQLPRKAA